MENVLLPRSLIVLISDHCLFSLYCLTFCDSENLSSKLALLVEGKVYQSIEYILNVSQLFKFLDAIFSMPFEDA